MLQTVVHSAMLLPMFGLLGVVASASAQRQRRHAASSAQVCLHAARKLKAVLANARKRRGRSCRQSAGRQITENRCLQRNCGPNPHLHHLPRPSHRKGFSTFAQMPNGLRKLFFLTCAAVTSCVRLDAGWQMQRASDVAAPGSSVATRDADTRGWLNVTLPCTVLGCLQQQVTR